MVTDAFDELLWQKLEAFPLDDPDAALKFSERLASENGWSTAKTRRVIFEYRRFLYLCARAGHPVTPSDEVDQAWHLHLCYTDSYWNRLCSDLLAFPLHHGPTAGGRKERVKYADWYARTLESYQIHFSEAAPEDLWPAPSIRFRPQAFQRIDRRQYFLLPRRAIGASLAALGIVTAVAGCGRSERFSDFKGVVLTGLLILAGSALLIALVRRSVGGGGRGGWGGCGGAGCGNDSGGCGGGGCGGGCGS